MNISKRTPITFATGKTPKKRTAVGALVVEESIPRNYHRKMVSPSGTVVRVPLATGNTIGPDVVDNPYRAVKLREKAARGFLMYAECPYATGALRTPKGVTPCKGTNESRPGAFWRRLASFPWYDEDICCEHMEQIITERAAAHAEKQGAYAEQYVTAHEKLARAEIARLEAKAHEHDGKGRTPKIGK